MEITQVEAPKMTMISQTFQIGAPGNPHGVTLQFEIEWVHNRWTKTEVPAHFCACGNEVPKPGELSFEVIKTPKKYTLKLSASQFEDLADDWRAGVINYEEWLLDQKNRQKVFNINLLKSQKSWVRKLLRRPVRVDF